MQKYRIKTYLSGIVEKRFSLGKCKTLEGIIPIMILVEVIWNYCIDWTLEKLWLWIAKKFKISTDEWCIQRNGVAYLRNNALIQIFWCLVSFFNSGVCYYRRSCSQMFFKISVLKNSAKFTGAHMCRSLFFKKVASLKLLARCFPDHFVKALRTPFL